MVHAVAEHGYAKASIAQAIRHAGVSRPTFYDYFKDKDDCFRACLGEIQRRLHADVGQAIVAGPPEEAISASVRTLVEFAATQPEQAHVLMNEAMAGGPRTLDVRDQGIAEIARLLQQAHEQLPSDTVTPDISPQLLIATVQRLLALRLRHREEDLDWMTQEILAWLAAYDQPAGEQRWRSLQPAGAPPVWHLPPETMLREPPPLPRKQARRVEDVLANRRERILYATAQAGREKGYPAVTVAEITKRAGIDRHAFNQLFADKKAAFEAVHEFGFQKTIAVVAGAFFAGEAWPERIWEAARAFTQYFQNNLTIAYVGFVESTAVGADAVKRLEDSINAFTIFFKEGYDFVPPNGSPPKPVALEAIATAFMEMGYHECRLHRDHQMEKLLPHVSFLCLAPFMGAAGANQFIEHASS